MDRNNDESITQSAELNYSSCPNRKPTLTDKYGTLLDEVSLQNS